MLLALLLLSTHKMILAKKKSLSTEDQGDSEDDQGEESNLERHEDDDEEDDDDDDQDGDDEEEDEDEEEESEPEDEGDEEDEEEEEGGEEDAAKSGWADAMAKVLNTGKTKDKEEEQRGQPAAKAILLSKAKKDSLSSASPRRKGEVDPAAARRAKKETEESCRRRPDVVADRARERALSRVATRGVVQLFNAVREQQKTLKGQLEAAGKSARKRDRVYKDIDRDAFLDVLAGGGGAKKRKAASSGAAKMSFAVKDEPPVDESSWKILRDDFMMGAKMKDWDKAGSESE